jgi:hypothetical protein
LIVCMISIVTNHVLEYDSPWESRFAHDCALHSTCNQSSAFAFATMLYIGCFPLLVCLLLVGRILGLLRISIQDDAICTDTCIGPRVYVIWCAIGIGIASIMTYCSVEMVRTLPIWIAQKCFYNFIGNIKEMIWVVIMDGLCIVLVHTTNGTTVEGVVCIVAIIHHAISCVLTVPFSKSIAISYSWMDTMLSTFGVLCVYAIASVATSMMIRWIGGGDAIGWNEWWQCATLSHFSMQLITWCSCHGSTILYICSQLEIE